MRVGLVLRYDLERIAIGLKGVLEFARVDLVLKGDRCETGRILDANSDDAAKLRQAALDNSYAVAAMHPPDSSVKHSGLWCFGLRSTARPHPCEIRSD
jgi:hypothetical protein